MEKNRIYARGTLKRPESNKKKVIIIIAVSVLVCLSASGGLYYVFHRERSDDFGPRRRREWNDTNMPNPQKQTGKEILAFIDSDKFKNLSDRERFMYMRQGGQKVMEEQMDTYFSLTDEKQKTDLLDQIIDRMESQRANFEQMRPPRRDPNDPNRPRNQFSGRRFSASNMRARSENGTPSQRARREAFFDAMRKRERQRGINPPGAGSRR